MVTALTLARGLSRVLLLVLAFVGARQVLGVWPTSVALSAGCLWLVVRGLHRLDRWPAPPRRAAVPDAVYPGGRPTTDERHVAFARALTVVAAAYQSECEQEASRR
jgi:hypothetical protein